MWKRWGYVVYMQQFVSSLLLFTFIIICYPSLSLLFVILSITFIAIIYDQYYYSLLLFYNIIQFIIIIIRHYHY